MVPARHGGTWRPPRLILLGAIIAAMVVIGGGPGAVTSVFAAGAPFRTGDLIQSGGSHLLHHSPQFGEIGSWTITEGDGAQGLAFDPDGELLVATGTGVARVSPDGFYAGPMFEADGIFSITVDGDAYIYAPSDTGTIRKYDATGDLIDEFSVANSAGESFVYASLAIAADDCTIYYVDNDTMVRRYDTCMESQLGDLGSGITMAIRIRLTPAGDALVSDVDTVHLFDGSTGSTIRDFGTPSSGVVWKSIALEPNGEHFWAVNQDDTDFHRFELASGDETVEGYAGIGEGGTGNDLVIYAGPDVLPDETISFYVNDLDNGTGEEDSLPFIWGCELRGRPHRAGAVILSFGQAFDQIDVEFNLRYGASLNDEAGTFANTSEIAAAIERFVRGYASYDPPGGDTIDCISPAEAEAPFLRLIIATTNFGIGAAGPDHTQYDHGVAWAQLVNSIGSWISTEGMGGIVDVAGGMDAEVNWNTAANSLDWAAGYSSVAEWVYYDIGDAAACPQTGTTSEPEDCEDVNFTWTQDDVWRFAWGLPYAYAFPQIYAENGSQAAQWQQLSLYGVLNAYAPIGFEGTLAQSQACEEVGCPSGTANTSAQAYEQLWSAINAGVQTESYIRSRSDISWCWSEAPDINCTPD